MNIGYIAPMSIAVVNGGLRHQALKTMEEVRKLDVNTLPLSPWVEIDREQIDLVHIFGATVENVGIAERLAAENIPFVLSPVFYSNRSALFIKISLNIELFSQFLGSGIRSDFDVKARMCQLAQKVLPNTLSEANLIEEGFSVPLSRIHVVPNGVENRFAEATPDLFVETYGLKDFILFAGQAGAKRKNVKDLLKAAKHLNAPLVVIGDFYEDAYGKECLALAEENESVHLIGTLPHQSELLASAYAASSVFVLPSDFETPGIAAMEAALAGSKIVITGKGGTKDYFGKNARYLNPGNIQEITDRVNEALQDNNNPGLRDHLLEQFTWDKVAKKTLELYKEVLS